MHKHVADLKTEFEVKSENDSVGRFTGVASTTDVDSDGDIIEAGAFEPIPTRVAPNGGVVPNVVMLRDHDRSQIIGGWRSFHQSGSELFVEGELCLAVQKARETHELMKRGDISGLSVCFTVSDPAHIGKDKSGRRLIKKGVLRECSIVGFPANANARIMSVKSEVDAWLMERGFQSGDLENLLRLLKQTEDEPLRSRIGRFAIVPRTEESRDDFMTRCLRKTGGDTEACRTVWNEREKQNNNNGEPPDPKADDDRASYMARCMRATGGDVEACSTAWDDWEESEGDEERADRRVFQNKAAENWTTGGSRDLPIAETERAWDGAAARARMLDRANIGTENGTANPTMARRGFLIYDSANPDLRGSYSLPFADIVDGTLKAIPSGLRAAASRLPQVTDVAQEVKDRARRVLDVYFGRMEDNGKSNKQPSKGLTIKEIDGHGIIDAAALAEKTREIRARLQQRAQR